VCLVLSLEETAEIVGHREDPAFAVLCCAWVESNLTGYEIDLAPF
jgi:hypothetical protein